MSTLAPERTTKTSEPELSAEIAHIAPADKVTEAYILGTTVEALCGALFVPSKDPRGKPVCQKCKEIYENLILPFRDDHSIKDDL